jgi:CRISPR-associated protein Cmr2
MTTNWKHKIKALLHEPDPLRNLLKDITGDSEIPEGINKASKTASIIERINELEVVFDKSYIITHPLSGKTMEMSVPEFALESVKSEAMEYEDNPKRLYFWLWRQLPDLLDSFWYYVPKDIKMPDVPIGHHLDATSAIAGASYDNDTPAFLLFSIGPVQSFIATARKTRDLWAGSFILSYLTFEAMKTIAGVVGADAIIFPQLRGQPLVDLWLKEEFEFDLPKVSEIQRLAPSFPNRFFAIVPHSKAEELAKNAKDSIKKAWMDISKGVKEELDKKNKNRYDWSKNWDSEVHEFFETYYTILPWSDDVNKIITRHKELFNLSNVELEDVYTIAGDKLTPDIGDGYGLLYEEIDRFFSSRKAIRDFEYFKGDEREKCTLCGAREQLGPAGEREEVKKFWENMRDQLKKVEIAKGERLCAPCLIKRFAFPFYFRGKLDIPPHFRFYYPSTSTIATEQFKEFVFDKISHDTKLMHLVKNYTEELKGLHNELGIRYPYPPEVTIPKLREKSVLNFEHNFFASDGEWLFEERFDKKMLEREYEKDRVSQDTLNRCVKALRELLNYAKDSDEDKISVKPCRYYAVLTMDGDDMGKWLSAEYSLEMWDILHPKLRDILEADTEWSSVLSKHRPMNPSVHFAISKALVYLSLVIARYIVEDRYGGRLVYSGGDDVLAFLPIETVLRCARDLRAFYSGYVKNDEVDFSEESGFIVFNGEKMTLMGNKATISAGIVFAHHLHPLSRVLIEAREALEKAKEEEEKDAFAISMMQRSGEKVETCSKWGVMEKHDVMGVISEVANAIKTGDLSSRFIYHLKEEKVGLEKLGYEPVQKEIKRLIARHSKNNLSELAEKIIGMGTVVDIDISKLIKLLLVARFIGKEGS